MIRSKNARVTDAEKIFADVSRSIRCHRYGESDQGWIRLQAPVGPPTSKFRVLEGTLSGRFGKEFGEHAALDL